jgi:HAL2 family 3'(2'),5'-bisphosphate nucleotidase
LTAAALCSLSHLSNHVRAFASPSALHQSSHPVNVPKPFGTLQRKRGFETTRTFSSAKDTLELPQDYPNLSSIEPALAAIRKACKITTHLQPLNATSTISSQTKKDASPVTIGDYAAQALVLNLLEQAFENDVFIAEESSRVLDEEPELALEILDVVQECGYQQILDNVEDLKRSIDLGQTYDESGYVSKEGRRWCLDPIDGTRGFLRGKMEGGQYCVALALMEDGVPIVGILGCPNLPIHPSEKDTFAWNENETEQNYLEGRGCIFVASRGGGCYQLPLYPPPNQPYSSTDGATRVSCTQSDGSVIPTSQARFCTGVESYSDALGETNAIAKKIHGKLNDEGDISFRRRMDSQVKYGVLARGEAEIMTRLPKKSYVEWIWDHAAGRVVIEEAGGSQTDTRGEVIDYGIGAKMDKDVDGILVSAGGVFHEVLVRSYREQAEERES